MLTGQIQTSGWHPQRQPGGESDTANRAKIGRMRLQSLQQLRLSDRITGFRSGRATALSVSCKAYKSKWKGWKDMRKGWEDPSILQKEAQRKLLQPSAALPVFAGLAIASMFGPLVLTIAASTIGLAFATVAGMTAVALFLPAAFFIGGTLAAFSMLGSIFSLLGIVPLVAMGYFWFKRSGRAKLLAAEREAAVRRDEWQAKEYRRQQEELELLQTQEEELESFDRRLRSR